LGDTVTDERVGVFTPDKDGDTHTSCGRVAVIAARRGTVCGEVGRVPGFPQLTVHTLYPPPPPTKHARSQRSSIGVALSPGPVSSTERARRPAPSVSPQESREPARALSPVLLAPRAAVPGASHSSQCGAMSETAGDRRWTAVPRSLPKFGRNPRGSLFRAVGAVTASPRHAHAMLSRHDGDRLAAAALADVASDEHRRRLVARLSSSSSERLFERKRYTTK